jgi:hypothetical protein
LGRKAWVRDPRMVTEEVAAQVAAGLGLEIT